MRRASGPERNRTLAERKPRQAFVTGARGSSEHPGRMDREAPAYPNSEADLSSVSGQRPAM